MAATATRAPPRAAARRTFERAALLTGIAALAALAPAASATSQAALDPTRQLAALDTAHTIRPLLARHPSRPRLLAATRPITAVQTVVPVVARETRDGTGWLRVMLPGRPNGALGWIREHGTTLTTTRWQIVVRRSRRDLLAYRDGRLVRTLRAIVGKPSTPTPLGRFFVEESVRLPPGVAGGPFALATSARSNVLQEFMGGPGQIAIHGVDHLGGVPGTAVSHGCVRLGGANIRWLAARIRPGVPVTIVR